MGQQMTFLNGGPVHALTPGFSYSVACKDQAELEVGFAQRLERGYRPWLDAVGRQQHGRGVAYLVDFDEAGTVGGNGVERCRRVRVQFQFARGFLFPPSRRKGGESH